MFPEAPLNLAAKPSFCCRFRNAKRLWRASNKDNRDGLLPHSWSTNLYYNSRVNLTQGKPFDMISPRGPFGSTRTYKEQANLFR